MTIDLEPHKKIKIFTGTANPDLAHAITRHLEMPMGDAVVGRFKDGEIKLRINETVRGADVIRHSAYLAASRCQFNGIAGHG